MGRRDAGRRLPAHAAPEPRRAQSPARAPARLPRALTLPACATTARPLRARRRRTTTRPATGSATSPTTATAAAAATNFTRAHAGRAAAAEPNAAATPSGPSGQDTLLRPPTGLAATIHALFQGDETHQPYARHRRVSSPLFEAERRRTFARGPARPILCARPPPLARHRPTGAAEAAETQPEL